MQPREWALVAFTVLAQLSAGAWLGASAAHAVFSRLVGVEAASRLVAPLAAWSAGVLGAAVIASLFHLGAPGGAPLALANLGSSWLSREILAAAVFGCALVLSAAALRWRPGSAVAVLVPGIVAALSGLALVLVMARIYRLAAQPAWDSIVTPVSFLLATAALGGAAAAAWATWHWLGAAGPEANPLAWNRLVAQLAAAFSLVAAVALGFELAVAPLGALASGAAGGGPAGIAGLLAGPHAWLLTARVALILSGAALLLVAAYRLATSAWGAVPASVGLTVLALVVAEEVVGRLLFYQLRTSLGL